MGRLIELLMNQVFLYLKLSLYFWGLVLIGGLVFGLGPASATILSAIAEHGSDHASIRWKDLWQSYKESFISSNLVTLFLASWFLLLLYGLFLLVQAPASFLGVSVTLINGLFLVLPLTLYLHWLQLQTTYSFSFLTGLKLSFIASFLSITRNLRLFLGLILLGLLSRWIPAFGFFLAAGLSLRFIHDCLKPDLTWLAEDVKHD